MVPEMVIGGAFIAAVILFAMLAASAQRSRRTARAGTDGSAGWVDSGDGCDAGADGGCDGGGGGGD